jgi:type I restriction enzyme S subunit
MKSGSIVKDHMKFVSKDRLSSLSETFQVKPGDIVMGMTGATLGKPCVNKTAETFLLNQRIGKFIPKGINPDYLLLALEYLERSFMSLSFGTGVNNLSTQQIKKSLIPLPPAEEQIQIVSIVSDLFSICDRLELSLITCQEIADKFARSVTSSSVQISSHA